MKIVFLILLFISISSFLFLVLCYVIGHLEYKKKIKFLESNGFERVERTTPYFYGYRTTCEWINKESIHSIDDNRVIEMSYNELVFELEDE